MGFSAFLEVPHGIVRILEVSYEICALLEVPRGIFCMFGSSSWDFVHYWKSIKGSCAFSEDYRGILCII